MRTTDPGIARPVLNPSADPAFWEPVARLIETKDRFVLATHVNADGDGLGSQVALYHLLKARGKQVRILNNDPPPANFAFFAPPSLVEVYDPARDEAWVLGAGAILLLDNSSAKRFGALQSAILASPAPKACIDHHPHPDTIWDVMAIDETAAATGQMVYRLIRAVEGSIPPEAAEALYVAIVTDTGNFRFNNTKADVLAIASDLVAAGVSVAKVYQEVYERAPAAYVRLVGAALSDMRLECEGRLGYLVIPRDMLKRCGAEDIEMGDLINNVLAIDGARASALFRETPEGGTKVSLRSKGDVNVNAVAALFGGGGHRNASGISMDVPLAEAMNRVLPELRRIV
jgi:phosphoesterase RecJ-like protein